MPTTTVKPVQYCFYKAPALSKSATLKVENTISSALGDVKFDLLETESCFYVVSDVDLTESHKERLQWIFRTPLSDDVYTEPQIERKSHGFVIEIGPRLNFSTAFSTNAMSICQSIGLPSVTRIEMSITYHLTFPEQTTPADDIREAVVAAIHDHMTHCAYPEPIKSFDVDIPIAPVYEIDVMGNGRKALEEASDELGLAFDDWDLTYYTELFQKKLCRNPTSVECFDLAQSNSEHSRHWFFRGRFVIDGTEEKESLFDLIKGTHAGTNGNSVIKFSDNSSAIQGFETTVLEPTKPGYPSSFVTKENEKRHIIFTAETHNFPTGVAPFPGATTGTGGRIRDVQATGRGAHVIAGTAGYSFGNLHIPGYDLPWEEPASYPPNLAPPLQIAIEASNGASDYGNKFGEPVIAGFARSFGQTVAAGDRREYVKPIMFSGGVGSMSAQHVHKTAPSVGMEVVKIGGPVYRIGLGGGAASSVFVQGDNRGDLDLGAVQRGDAEMEQKLNRVIRACVELGADNPVQSIHDQGAGGNGNVLKEIVEPCGAVIKSSAFTLGDPTLSVMEIWGAEYQESNAVLVKNEDMQTLANIGARERCDITSVGSVTGDGKIRLIDDISPKNIEKQKNQNIQMNGEANAINGEATTIGDTYSSQENIDLDPPETKRPRCEPNYAVDLDLELVLGKMPRKVFEMTHHPKKIPTLSLPANLQVAQALDRVLRLPSVASKRYLTNKVDRSVTGLIAQQQCVGPLHTPLADVAVTALSHFSTVGSATAIGEQPVKGLVDSAAGARMSLGEALTNLVFAQVTDLKDVKVSGNWMWAAKLEGEGAELHAACVAMCEAMKGVGVAVDGGKDSLSMAARVGEETVKAPGTLVISAYVGCPNITKTVTPDLKVPGGKGSLLHVHFGPPKYRLGGSALAQCYTQLGRDVPDMDDTDMFVKAFIVTQTLIKERRIQAGHDVSDGGLITCILEMAFAGNCGISVDLSPPENVSTMEALFNEELGIVIEVGEGEVDGVVAAFGGEGVHISLIGNSTQASSTENNMVSISMNGEQLLSSKMADLRDMWEDTSFHLEMLQSNPECVAQERDGLKSRRVPPYYISEDIDLNSVIPPIITEMSPKIAVIREEGSNGDREMAAAFTMAGFQAWDVNMQDLLSGAITLDRFRGVAFVGGFSYADVCGSAKGWAATVAYNDAVRAQFEAFRSRSDTFSLGVCNGCQLMALLGWVAPYTAVGDTSELPQGLFLDHNKSGRFESRFPAIKISESPAVMLKGLEGVVWGMWVAHGEGQMIFRNTEILANLHDQNLCPIRYVDDDANPTESYPHNPNGSPGGIAGVCSQDGRHLALMPHPERCVLNWQLPYIPSKWNDRVVKYSPWIKMFTNAYDWCLKDGGS